MKNKYDKYFKFGFALVILLIVAVYSKTLFFDFVLFDDDIKIIDNYEKLTNLKNIKDAFYTDSYFQKEGLYYRPTLTLSLMHDAIIGGKNPFHYHLTNLLLHIVSCWFLFYFIDRMALRTGKDEETNVSISELKTQNLTLKTQHLTLILVAFFAVSPLLINAVAWIPGRNDILMTIFLLLSFTFFKKAVETKKFRWRIVHLLFLFLAFLSKETALIFPVILYSYQILINRSKLLTKENINYFIQWIILILFYLKLRSNVVISMGDFNTIYNNFIYNIPLIPELLGKFFMPVNLSGIPGYSLINTLTGIVILLLIIGFIFLNKEKRYNLLFGLIWIVITLLPGMFASRGQANFDYLECRAYLPMIGILIFVFSLINEEKILNSNMFRYFSVLAVLVYTFINVISSFSYENPIEFYNNAISKNPNSAIAYNNRGLIMQSKGKIQESINDFTKSIKIDRKFAEAYFNLGTLLSDIGQLEQALALYDIGLSIKRDSYKVYYMRANLKLKKGDIDGAKIDFEIILKYDSLNSKAYFGLASIHFQAGEFEEAIKDYDKALKLNPKYIQAYMNRGVTYAFLKKFGHAIKDYNDAEKLESNNPDLFYFRANAKFLNKDTMGACLDWYKAAELGNEIVPKYISEYCR